MEKIKYFKFNIYFVLAEKENGKRIITKDTYKKAVEVRKKYIKNGWKTLLYKRPIEIKWCFFLPLTDAIIDQSFFN